MWCAPVHRSCLPLIAVLSFVGATAIRVAAEPDSAQRHAAKPPLGRELGAERQAAAESAERQAELEAALSKMLSGATLEGSFTNTGAGNDPAKLGREKYTLGDVKKVAGEVWQFPSRIQYGGKDVTLPILLPIRWAGDTPVVVVDRVELPGFGSVSARVLFFDGHYAGYWKHGEHSGHLFGVIHSADGKTTPSTAAPQNAPAPSGSDPPAQQKP